MISKHSKAVVDKMYGLGVFHALVVAEKVVRLAGDGLLDTAKLLKLAATKCTEGASVVYGVANALDTEIGYIKEGEVFEAQIPGLNAPYVKPVGVAVAGGPALLVPDGYVADSEGQIA